MMLGLISYFKQLTFANKEYLWAALIIIPLLALYYIWKKSSLKPELKLSSIQNFKNASKTLKQRLIHLPFLLRLFSLTLLFIALARPQSSLSWQDVSTEGIDIIISMDISASMLAKDFKPNRLEAAKAVATEFIDARYNDRIGLIIFSGEAFTQCPLTTDHAVLKNLFASIKTGMVADGTAIGMGLATAVNRIKDSKAKSKVVILLTDGVNNSGNIAPETAADIAKQFGVRLYTIGVGTIGNALSPVAVYPDGSYVYDYVPVQIDDKLLTGMAKITGGKYFRATSKNELEKIYQEIDKLEKTKIEVSEFRKRKEEFWWFALSAGIILVVEFLFRNVYLKML